MRSFRFAGAAGSQTPKHLQETLDADWQSVSPIPLPVHFGESDMEIFQNASDDQIALMGCAAALLFSGGLMYVSYFVGQGRRSSEHQAAILMEQNREAQRDESTRRAA